jgi:DNA-binding MarR family transcriptional regulator
MSIDGQTTSLPEHADDLADALPTLGRFSRLLSRAIRADRPMDHLPDAQVDLLRVVGAQPGLRVAAAAEALGVAPNTVSTLVRELVAAGLLHRARDGADRRSASLVLTPGAETLLAALSEHRDRVFREIIAGLDEDERGKMAAAVPGLMHLQTLLEQRARSAGRARR